MATKKDYTNQFTKTTFIFIENLSIDKIITEKIKTRIKISPQDQKHSKNIII